MSIVLFCLLDNKPISFEFLDTQLSEALKMCETLRKNEHASHVCIASELDQCITKAGVDAVEDGKTPDGHEYTWSKQHRGAGPRVTT